MRPENGEAHADEGAVLVEPEHSLDVITGFGDVEVVATCETIDVRELKKSSVLAVGRVK